MAKADSNDTAILPAAMPTATTMELRKVRLKSALAQAVCRLAMNWSPGSHGRGTFCTSAIDSDPATNAKYSGTHTSSAPAIRIAWQIVSRMGARSTMRSDPVIDLVVEIAELQQRADQCERHQQHRLRRRGAEVEIDETVDVDLVDQDVGRDGRPAVGDGIAYGKASEEAVDGV